MSVARPLHIVAAQHTRASLSQMVSLGVFQAAPVSPELRGTTRVTGTRARAEQIHQPRPGAAPPRLASCGRSGASSPGSRQVNRAICPGHLLALPVLCLWGPGHREQSRNFCQVDPVDSSPHLPGPFPAPQGTPSTQPWGPVGRQVSLSRETTLGTCVGAPCGVEPPAPGPAAPLVPAER